MNGLRILLTNRGLEAPAGTETYVRDVALGLQRAGHAPMVWSPRLGDVADAIRSAAIPVTDRLEALGSTPDVIHGHHGVPTLAALARFPGVPALYVCHDASSFLDVAPSHPRIRRYAAVDDGCLERLVNQEGIPARRCIRVPNAVDLARFRPRGPLPPRPVRALAFGHKLAKEELAALDAVCRERGIRLEGAGARVGGRVAEPERRLGSYDLVFAKGRCALEAMAVGAAVVVCGPGGLGPLVTTADIDALRPLNFGRRAYRLPFDAPNLHAQLDRYDPADAAAVSRRMRSIASLDGLTAELLDLYETILEEERAAPTSRAEEEAAFADAFLWIARVFEEAVGSEARRLARRRSRRGWLPGRR